MYNFEIQILVINFRIFFFSSKKIACFFCFFFFLLFFFFFFLLLFFFFCFVLFCFCFVLHVRFFKHICFATVKFFEKRNIYHWSIVTVAKKKQKYIWHNVTNMPSDMCSQWRFWSSCEFAQSSLGVVWIAQDASGQRMFCSDCADAQADFSLRWAQCQKVRFLMLGLNFISKNNQSSFNNNV